ncbi:MAG: FtsQ-type POTRA domain-containing protein [Alphaproteobacteria bacterium]|nr:FtsQ-type POTRA domain-containing protein [Alphaproteobacteria bacterium]
MRRLIARLLPQPAPRSRSARRARRGIGRRGATALGLAVAAIAGAGLLWQAERSGRIAVIGDGLSAAFVDAAARLGLTVANIEVEGRAMTARDTILRAVGAARGTPTLAVSPPAVKARLEELPWIRSAAVERRLPDTLHIRIVERTPLAFWQHRGKLALIDREGAVVTDEHLERFANLIIVVGDDAPRCAAALLDMLASEPDLAGRVVAAVRIGGRRWNLRLDNGIDVELPEEATEAAWTQLAQLERTSRVLARDVQAVDMRLPDRLVLRVTPEPPKEPMKKGRQAAKST